MPFGRVLVRYQLSCVSVASANRNRHSREPDSDGRFTRGADQRLPYTRRCTPIANDLCATNYSNEHLLDPLLFVSPFPPFAAYDIILQLFVMYCPHACQPPGLYQMY